MNTFNSIPAITFTDVHKTFKDKEHSILKGISGTVMQGSLVMMVGPSGSGKSTLLSMCNLLSAPDEGSIEVYGKNISKWNISDLRKKVGIAFQSAPVIDGTVRDNMMLVQKLHGKQDIMPEELCALIGLSPDLLEQDARDLSGGQRQRLSLARTLSNGSDLLLLDEITSALDATSAHEIEQLISHLHKEQNKTIIWVTHNLDQAKRLGEEVWLLMNGVIVEKAKTEAFFHSPVKAETKQFIEGAFL